jgi:hypothetical protein
MSSYDNWTPQDGPPPDLMVPLLRETGNPKAPIRPQGVVPVGGIPEVPATCEGEWPSVVDFLQEYWRNRGPGKQP